MKLLLSLLILVSVITANEKQKTDEELVAEFMRLVEQEKEADRRIKEAREKTKELRKLRETVEELSKTLGVD